ncbi:hypothetical protein OAN307_c24950 [Octadecabacter antarcticus 307]|uniref:Outer membrane protein beta-barrel domain-containing protein n=2 Tax=Octadecabacter TaxID=53945 RepID=M9RE64_9RHOB|nr:hypothetical protein OAN307_c24950 [Octadecabacter antarcticus 307]
MVAHVVPMATQMTPSTDWTGFYVGGQYVRCDAGDSITSDDAGGFGLHAGCLRDLWSFVVGGEFDYDVPTIDIGAGVDADFAHLKAIADHDLGAFMPYIKAGFAAFDLDSGFSDTVDFYGLGARYAINDNDRIGGGYLAHDTDELDRAAHLRPTHSTCEYPIVFTGF